MSHEHHESHGLTYLMVFGALCVFTGMSWAADSMHMADKNVLRVIVLAIATAKALCVMLYFMHLKFERAWKYLLLAPTFILASALPFALAPDVGLRYYTSEAPQLKEHELQVEAAGHHGGGHAAGDHATGDHGDAAGHGAAGDQHGAAGDHHSADAHPAATTTEPAPANP
jgi:cytochrome c oxidase subunit IV